ncbi:hypothetical protein NDU88_004881, partial [Pleurodeles waltl]
GHAQDLIAGKKKECNLQCAELEREIAVLEAHYHTEGEVEGGLLHLLHLKWQDLHTLAEQHAWAYTLASQSQLYDVDDKDNKLLVWLDRRDRERSWVREIWNKEGAPCRSNEAIAEAFATYHEGVYALATQMTVADCRDLLRDIPLPELSEQERGALDAE